MECAQDRTHIDPMNEPTNTRREVADVAPYVSTLLGPGAELFDIQAQPLAGGLVAEFVWRLRLSYADVHGVRRSRDMVVKQLDATNAREARIYQALAETPARDFIPRLCGVEAQPRNTACLYLELVEAKSVWPWTRIEDAGRVLEHLAALHERHAHALFELVGDWDYELELEQRAASTLDTLERVYACGRDRITGMSLPAARRLVRGIRGWRHELVNRGPLCRTVIHGDVHPGNVIVRADDETPLLLDWARTRIGSPLEDVSSWLQWLGFWEPAVKRKHDTLLARYLRARGLPRYGSRSLRAAYWLAGASNCLAGALRYHLLVWSDPQSHQPLRAVALSAARDCLRVLRRADAYLRSTQSSDSSMSNETSLGA